MFEFQSLRLMHWHGDDEWVPMEESQHNANSHDPEREWLKGAKIFRCSACAEEVAVTSGPPEEVVHDRPHPAV